MDNEEKKKLSEVKKSLYKGSMKISDEEHVRHKTEAEATDFVDAAFVNEQAIKRTGMQDVARNFHKDPNRFVQLSKVMETDHKQGIQVNMSKDAENEQWWKDYGKELQECCRGTNVEVLSINEKDHNSKRFRSILACFRGMIKTAEQQDWGSRI